MRHVSLTTLRSSVRVLLERARGCVLSDTCYCSETRGVEALLLGEEKHDFLLYHIVVLTVIFKYVMIVRANEGLLRWSSRAQFAFWLISSARWVDVCVSFGLIHIGFQCAMFCFVFFWGGLPLLQMWNFNLTLFFNYYYYYINIDIKVWVVEPFRKVGSY